MCYSFKSSITAWLFSLISCIYMLSSSNYNNWIPLFILTFTQIQIMEAVIWTSMGKNNEVNSQATKLILFLLFLQPLLNSYIGYKNTNNDILLYLCIFYILIIIYYYFSTKNDKFLSTVGPNHHLVWNRSNNDGKTKQFFGNGIFALIYLVGMFLPFLFYKGKMGIITIIFGLVTFILTAINYKDEFSSMWCYSSVLLSFIALVFNRKSIDK